jgi:hypothetical protein
VVSFLVQHPHTQSTPYHSALPAHVLLSTQTVSSRRSDRRVLGASPGLSQGVSPSIAASCCRGRRRLRCFTNAQGASPSALPRSLPANVAAMLARHPGAGTRADTAGREFRVSGSQASTAADEGPSTRTETLKAHLDRLQAGIRECTAERLRLQRSCHGEATPRKLSEHQSDVALVLFVLSAASPDACLAYLRRAVGDRNATVLKDIEERFLRMPLHEVAKIDQSDATWKLKAENQAKTFLREWNLATWVRSQNADKGVAPAFRHVLSRKRSVEADPRRETASAVAATDKCCKQWVRRWMHRWHGARRKLSVQEATNVEELNRKAGNPGHIF